MGGGIGVGLWVGGGCNYPTNSDTLDLVKATRAAEMLQHGDFPSNPKFVYKLPFPLRLKAGA